LESKKLLSISIIILAMSVIFGCIWIGNSLEKSISLQTSISNSTNNVTLTLPQVSEYLDMTEEEVQSIIQTEKKQLDEIGSFDGKMFPYFTVNNKQYFYKSEIDEWLKEVSSHRRQYNTTEGWVF
jgi:hypothetical protein